MLNYTSSLAVSADGLLYTDTTWEEELRPAGTYHEGDAVNKERRYLPLRLDDAPIKGSLARFLYINSAANSPSANDQVKS